MEIPNQNTYGFQPNLIGKTSGTGASGFPAVQGRPFINRILGGIVLIASLLLYWTTTCPVVYFGDAGEFIVAAWRGGIAHPPGYPLYVILLAIFLRLPLRFFAPHSEFMQPVAWQANLFSAIIGAVTVWVIYLILLRILRRNWWAFAGALLAITGKTFWSQTGIAEVYTLNALLASIIALVALLMTESEPGSDRRHQLFKLGSLTWGLSLSNHHEMVFFVPVWITMLYLAIQPGPWKPGTSKPPGRILRDGILFFLLGLLPYLYLPVASSFHPVLNWGHPSNPINFFRVLTRAEYRGIKAHITGDLVTSWDILTAFLRWSLVQYFPAYLLLAIPGLSLLFRRSPQRAVLLSLALSLFLTAAVFIVYFARIDRGSLFFLEVYFIPWYLTLAILAAIGCATIFTAGAFHADRVRPPAMVGGILVMLILTAASWWVNRKSSDMSDHIAGYVYSHDVLASLPAPPQKTILVTGGDEIFLFWYWQWVEGTDKDFAAVGLDALEVRRSWFWDDLKRDHPDLAQPDIVTLSKDHSGADLRWRVLDSLMALNLGSYRTFMTVWDRSLDPLLHETPWHLVIDGPVLEIERDTSSLIADYPRASTPEEAYLFRELLKVNRSGLDPYERDIYSRYAAACYNLAVYFSQNGEPARAAEFSKLCLQFDEHYSPGGHLTTPQELLAYSLYRAGDFELARQMLEDLIATNPNESIYHAYLAEVFIATGDEQSAKTELSLALRLEPDNPSLINRYRQLFGNQ
jgi:hypothetical protein